MILLGKEEEWKSQQADFAIWVWGHGAALKLAQRRLPAMRGLLY